MRLPLEVSAHELHAFMHRTGFLLAASVTPVDALDDNRLACTAGSSSGYCSYSMTGDILDNELNRPVGVIAKGQESRCRVPIHDKLAFSHLHVAVFRNRAAWCTSSELIRNPLQIWASIKGPAFSA